MSGDRSIITKDTLEIASEFKLLIRGPSPFCDTSGDNQFSQSNRHNVCDYIPKRSLAN